MAAASEMTVLVERDAELIRAASALALKVAKEGYSGYADVNKLETAAVTYLSSRFSQEMEEPRRFDAEEKRRRDDA